MNTLLAKNITESLYVFVLLRFSFLKRPWIMLIQDISILPRGGLA